MQVPFPKSSILFQPFIIHEKRETPSGHLHKDQWIAHPKTYLTPIRMKPVRWSRGYRIGVGRRRGNWLLAATLQSYVLIVCRLCRRTDTLFAKIWAVGRLPEGSGQVVRLDNV